MKSTAPGRYFRSGSGTLNPLKEMSVYELFDRVDSTYLLGLEVLQQTAQSSLGRTKGGVECMDVFDSDISLQLGTVSDVKSSGLVVRAVGARNQLLVLSLEWKPGLEIELLRSGVVQSPRDDSDNSVWNAQRSVELLGNANHIIESFP